MAWARNVSSRLNRAESKATVGVGAQHATKIELCCVVGRRWSVARRVVVGRSCGVGVPQLDTRMHRERKTGTRAQLACEQQRSARLSTHAHALVERKLPCVINKVLRVSRVSDGGGSGTCVSKQTQLVQVGRRESAFATSTLRRVPTKVQ